MAPRLSVSCSLSHHGKITSRLEASGLCSLCPFRSANRHFIVVPTTQSDRGFMESNPELGKLLIVLKRKTYPEKINLIILYSYKNKKKTVGRLSRCHAVVV